MQKTVLDVGIIGIKVLISRGEKNSIVHPIQHKRNLLFTVYLQAYATAISQVNAMTKEFLKNALN